MCVCVCYEAVTVMDLMEEPSLNFQHFYAASFFASVVGDVTKTNQYTLKPVQLIPLKIDVDAGGSIPAAAGLYKRVQDMTVEIKIMEKHLHSPKDEQGSRI